MIRHIELLALLCLIWGGLALVAGLSILVLAGGALAVVTSAQRAAYEGGLAAGLTAFTFFLLGIGSLIWGGAHVLTGFAMRRHQRWARLAGLALAVLNLFFLPFGTALAIYAFWVLLSDQSRRLFEPAESPVP